MSRANDLERLESERLTPPIMEEHLSTGLAQSGSIHQLSVLFRDELQDELSRLNGSWAAEFRAGEMNADGDVTLPKEAARKFR